MGEANRRAEALQGRPKCDSCPHYVNERPVGHCRRFPPTHWMAPQQNPLRAGEMQLVNQSSYPIQKPNGYCGEHPDFLRWYSQNRDRAGAIDALEREAVAAS